MSSSLGVALLALILSGPPVSDPWGTQDAPSGRWSTRTGNGDTMSVNAPHALPAPRGFAAISEPRRETSAKPSWWGAFGRGEPKRGEEAASPGAKSPQKPSFWQRFRRRGEQPPSDAVLTTRARRLVYGDRELSVCAVMVSVQDGVLLLRGKVATPALRDRAEQVARKTVGIRDLRNDIELQSPEPVWRERGPVMLSGPVPLRSTSHRERVVANDLFSDWDLPNSESVPAPVNSRNPAPSGNNVIEGMPPVARPVGIRGVTPRNEDAGELRKDSSLRLPAPAPWTSQRFHMGADLGLAMGIPVSPAAPDGSEWTITTIADDLPVVISRTVRREAARPNSQRLSPENGELASPDSPTPDSDVAMVSANDQRAPSSVPTADRLAEQSANTLAPLGELGVNHPRPGIEKPGQTPMEPAQPRRLGATETVKADIERILATDPRAQRLRYTLQDGDVILTGEVASAADLFTVIGTISELPGVEYVTYDRKGLRIDQ